ncbi:hypothetical protein ACJ8PQ_20385, partial [Serratia sp. CY74664]|uniref:hypothetical protein n=1 Tax=Serratia sp. CY74664 TaxID=3383676 RepID=UPI003F9F03CF
TGALTALAGNNLAGALASGASPYLATEIKKLTVPHPVIRRHRPAGIPQVISRFADKPHDKLSRNVILFFI